MIMPKHRNVTIRYLDKSARKEISNNVIAGSIK